ncbi:hypothetical protein NQ314_007040 [Rhamnusium bicolor]|uniref:Peptidase S1 domain-containing protein n=1 Tax=Rhamnusium bicolor TaxID=1586634 RepID=A0AAV8YT41_9CUCU|nr:hypothetical protein NQ314_007040 [Rhamnusium bicolor]
MPGSYSVRAGSKYIYKGGVIVYVKQAILHPNHSKENEDFDIAILKFFQPLRYSASIKPVKLPHQDEQLPLDTMGYISGWGSISSHYPFISDELRAVEVPVLSNDICVNSYENIVHISHRMFCAGYKIGGRDSCQGDSGGPFVVKGTLYGLVSWGFNCAQPGYPGVYTNISTLRDYIRANTGV